MPNTIRIKRSSSAASPGSLLNAELAYSEISNKLFIGVSTSGTGGTAASVVAIGGSGAYFTLDTAQTVASTGIKTFDTTNFKLIGGSNGQFLRTDGTGAVSWATTSVDAYSSISGDSGGTITATGATPLRITGGTAVTTSVSEVVSDTVTINVADATTTAKGIVQLSAAINSTSNALAATPKAVKDAYDLANAALPKSGGEMSNFITLHADPTNDFHAATKKYVDNKALGLDVKESVRAATAQALPGTPTYSNGTDGLGATLTGGTGASANALGTIDGVTLSAGQRILVKDQGSGNSLQNGIYTVTSLGTSGLGTGYVLTRATDADSNREVTPGMFVFVEEGTRNSDNGFVLNTNGSITLGTTSLSFTQFSGAGKITIAPNTGLQKDGDELSITVVPAANGGTGITSYTVGDLLYASASTPPTLSKLAGVATGNALISGGVGVAPAWGKIALGTHVSGTLPVANGGTGITSFGTGVATFLQTPSSANLAAAVTGATGSGALVFATSPSLTTPVIGAATGTSLALTGGSLTARAAATQDAVTLAGRAGGTGSFGVTISPTTLTANRTVTLADGNTTLQTGTMAITGGTLGQFAATTSAALAGVISDETGFQTGALAVFNDGPTFKNGVVAGTSTLDVFNTVATTVNAFGAATASTIGYSGTAASSTTNIATGALGSAALTKVINIGSPATSNTSGAATNINIGSNTGVGITDIKSPTVVIGNTSAGTTTTINSATVTVTSGGLTTAAATGNIFNAAATTALNIGLSATALVLGASASGTTSIRNKVQLANATTGMASINLGTGTTTPTSPVNGDLWVNGGSVKFYNGGAAAVTLLDDDDVIDGGSFS
jgi:hypothetical protein